MNEDDLIPKERTRVGGEGGGGGGGGGGVGTMSRLFAKLTTICNDLQGLDSNSFLLCWWFFQLRISELCLFLFP